MWGKWEKLSSTAGRAILAGGSRSQDDNLVRPVLSDSVKGIDKLRVSLRVHDERAAVAMELGNQHTFRITRQF